MSDFKELEVSVLSDEGATSSVFSSTIFVDFPSFDVSIKHTTCPTSTESPSLALSVITPLSSAGNSKVALSLSSSAIIFFQLDRLVWFYTISFWQTFNVYCFI